jgi:protein-tyrosine phosphatase
VPYSILFICTGNICRSPAAERLFAAGLRGDAQVGVSSAGTLGLTGHGIDRPTALALRELGVDPDGHTARRLSAPIVTAADLILTASAEHRAAVLHEQPLKLNRSFTLREFQRLAASLPAAESGGLAPATDELRARVALIAAERGLHSPVAAGADDIADPFGASVDVARRCVAQLAELVDSILRALSLGA